ncbi:MAG: tail fiber domain-containing protein [Pseudomonadota bacterium]
MKLNSKFGGLATSAAALALSAGLASAQNFVTDVTIQGSLCVGIDCSTSESFGFDTIRLKENNLRIGFNDTSSSASFPSNDWELTANDSSNGGSNRFSITDVTAGRAPFTVEAGAQANTLFVEADGDVGIKTNNPVVDVHIVEGNTPTVRLEQDGSDGFAPQVFDIAANETNFFVRDVTNGSQLPFRIFPGSGNDDAFVIRANGNVGMGTDDPRAKMHINNGGSPFAASANDDLVIQDDGPARFALVNTTKSDNADESNVWTFNGNGTLRISASNDAAEMILTNAGNMTILGTLTEGSDRNSKTGITPVDPAEILAKVEALPVSHWSYKTDAESGVSHIGPMAQDFYAAFGTGATDKGISSLDSSGVALAAIQALSQRIEELEQELDALR